MVRLAIISDTHWPVWDPQRFPLCTALLQALSRYDQIWHAGDVVDESILQALERLAPVVCVKGNCDSFFGRDLPHAVHRQVEEVHIGMIHGWDLPLDHGPSIASRFPDETEIIIHGHTHQQRFETVAGQEGGETTIINPGSISQPRGGDTRGYGELVVNGDQWSYRRVQLG